MFSNSTLALGILSLVVCAAIVIYALICSTRLSAFAMVGLALVFAGGLGNAIDRFALGYVVDFIDLAFIDFPVFNIADIGVTCGIILFIITLFASASHEAHQRSEQGREGGSRDGA